MWVCCVYLASGRGNRWERKLFDDSMFCIKKKDGKEKGREGEERGGNETNFLTVKGRGEMKDDGLKIRNVKVTGGEKSVGKICRIAVPWKGRQVLKKERIRVKEKWVQVIEGSPGGRTKNKTRKSALNVTLRRGCKCYRKKKNKERNRKNVFILGLGGPNFAW